MSRVLTADPKNLQEALARLHEFRIQQGSQSFFRGLCTFAILGSERITKSIQLFEKLRMVKGSYSISGEGGPEYIGFHRGKGSKKHGILDRGCWIGGTIHRTKAIADKL